MAILFEKYHISNLFIVFHEISPIINKVRVILGLQRRQNNLIRRKRGDKLDSYCLLRLLRFNYL